MHRYLHVLTHSFPTRRSSDLQRRGQGLAVAAAGLAYAGEQQREEGEEANGADDHGKARTAGGRGHARSSVSFAAGRCAGLARKRLSSAVTNPPSAISTAPSQIQRTKGLMCRRIAQSPAARSGSSTAPSGSPSAT